MEGFLWEAKEERVSVVNVEKVKAVYKDGGTMRGEGVAKGVYGGGSVQQRC